MDTCCQWPIVSAFSAPLRLCVKQENTHKIMTDPIRQLDEREIQKALQNEDAADGAERRQRAARQKLERLNAVLEQLYQDREAGVLLEGEFRTLLARNREERAGWEGILEEARQHMEQESTHRDFAEQIHQFLTFDTLDRAAVTSLLARVLIHTDQTVELEFRFRRPEGQETV